MKQLPARMRVPVYIAAAAGTALLGGLLLLWAISHADYSFGGGRSDSEVYADIYFIMISVLCIVFAFGDRAVYREWYRSRTVFWRLLRGLAIMLTVLICYFLGGFVAIKLHP